MLLLFLLCYVVQPLFQYYSVFARRESLQRFIVEDGVKPAIFGSYSYDPVKQEFFPPPPDGDHTGPGGVSLEVTSKLPQQIVNDSFVFSTAVGEVTGDEAETGSTNHTEQPPVFRKPHVTPATGSKNPAWWMRPKLSFKNATSSVHKINKV